MSKPPVYQPPPVWDEVADYTLDPRSDKTIEEQILEAYHDFMTRFGCKPKRAFINTRSSGQYQMALEDRLGMNAERLASVSKVAPGHVQFCV